MFIELLHQLWGRVCLRHNRVSRPRHPKQQQQQQQQQPQQQQQRNGDRQVQPVFVHVGVAQPRHYFAAADLHVKVFHTPHKDPVSNTSAAAAAAAASEEPRVSGTGADQAGTAATGAASETTALAVAAAAAAVAAAEAAAAAAAAAANSWGGLMARLDRMLALQLNDTLEEQGNGRSALLLAIEFPVGQHAEVLAAGLTCSTPMRIISNSGTAPTRNSSSSSSSSSSSGAKIGNGSSNSGSRRSVPGGVDALHDINIPYPPSSSSSSSTSKGSISSSSSSAIPPMMLFLMRSLTRDAIHPGLGCSADEVRILGAANVDSFGDIIPKRTRRGPMDTGNVWIKRPGYAYVSNVAVSPSARRKGVATALMNAAGEVARGWGCSTTALHVNPNNSKALGLYASIGYRATSVREPAFMPYLQGRPPDRCVLYVKRVPQHKQEEEC
ncbi:MAG: hypothetical protein WDW38_003838 [Sanguina aurantia]